MTFDKNHAVWKSAPWHVKISVLGVPSMTALKLYAYAGFFIGLGCFIAGTFFGTQFDPQFRFFLLAGSGFGLAGCLYMFAVAWVLANPESLQSDDA